MCFLPLLMDANTSPGGGVARRNGRLPQHTGVPSRRRIQVCSTLLLMLGDSADMESIAIPASDEGVRTAGGVGVGGIVGSCTDLLGVCAGCPLREGTIGCSSMTETANPMLATGLPLVVSSILKLLTPITLPSRSISGPPLLPGFIAASVCNRSTPFTVLIEDTMLRVTVRLLPNLPTRGKPSARTSSPTRTPAGFPTAIA